MATKTPKPKYRERRRDRQEGSEWQARGYDSRFEYTIAQRLALQDVDFRHHPDSIQYVRACTYTPDFLITSRSGKQIYIETKGYWTPSDRSKHKLVCAQNPDKDIRLVFMNANNKLNKSSNTTYADWCTRYKIQWSNLVIPDAWLAE